MFWLLKGGYRPEKYVLSDEVGVPTIGCGNTILIKRACKP